MFGSERGKTKLVVLYICKSDETSVGRKIDGYAVESV
jgi:hypothetical protein